MKKLFCLYVSLFTCFFSLHIQAQTGIMQVSVHAAPDYASMDAWAAHPWKYDASDSVPKPLRKNYRPDSTADVFFLHPTSYLERTRPFGWNAPVDDSALNYRTDSRSILYQASIFNECGRVFAPRYRQANYHAYFLKDTPMAYAIFDTAYQDIKRAFIYYLEHYNNGRPIIIAAHSQGSTHGKMLIKEFFDGKPLQKKLVAAYLVGMPIEPDYFANIPPCNKPDQTGCVCSWRTFKENNTDSFIVKEKFTAIVTNPLTWDAEKPATSRKDNKGGILLKFNKLEACVASAEVYGGLLWTVKPHFFGNILYKATNYHIGDFNLYYLNVRENAAERVKAFLKK